MTGYPRLHDRTQVLALHKTSHIGCADDMGERLPLISSCTIRPDQTEASEIHSNFFVLPILDFSYV